MKTLSAIITLATVAMLPACTKHSGSSNSSNSNVNISGISNPSQCSSPDLIGSAPGPWDRHAEQFRGNFRLQKIQTWQGAQAQADGHTSYQWATSSDLNAATQLQQCMTADGQLAQRKVQSRILLSVPMILRSEQNRFTHQRPRGRGDDSMDVATSAIYFVDTAGHMKLDVTSDRMNNNGNRNRIDSLGEWEQLMAREDSASEIRYSRRADGQPGFMIMIVKEHAASHVEGIPSTGFRTIVLLYGADN